MKEEQKEIKSEELLNSLQEMKNKIASSYASINSQIKTFKSVEHPMRDLRSTTNTLATTFNSYSKQDILSWLSSPEANEESLRDASINKYNTSTQYKRLLHYYSGIPMWEYILSPTRLNPLKVTEEEVLEAYQEACREVEVWNLKHELKKAALVALREDVFYGVEDSTKDSFHIVKIDPDICYITDMVDGVYRFGIDMSKISEDDLIYYPKVISSMYAAYQQDPQTQIQLVPEKACWCLKFNETIDYNIPPFVSTLIDLADIDEYKDLQLAKTEIQNYKALAMRIPSDTQGVPTMHWDEVTEYYAQVANVLPDYVGLIASPMKIEEFNFESSGGLNDTDTVMRAEEQFWTSTGTSSLLFGSSKNNSAGALKLSVRADEEFMFEFMTQCERLINRRLKLLKGKIQFKINILPITVFNYSEMVDLYSKAITYGYPVKRMAMASLGLSPDDIISQSYFENDVLNMTEKFVPVSTSHTQTNNSADRTDTEENTTEEVVNDEEQEV